MKFRYCLAGMLWLQLATLVGFAEPIYYTVYGSYVDGNVERIDLLRYIKGLSPGGDSFGAKLSVISPFFDAVQPDSPELQTIRKLYAEKLRSAVRSKNSVNRAMALWCLKQVPEFPDNWEVFRAACSDPDICVRSAAISVLALIGTPEAFAILKNRLQSPDPEVQYECCSAVLRMSPKYHSLIQEELLRLSKGESPYSERSKQLYNLHFGPLPEGTRSPAPTGLPRLVECPLVEGLRRAYLCVSGAQATGEGLPYAENTGLSRHPAPAASRLRNPSIEGRSLGAGCQRTAGPPRHQEHHPRNLSNWPQV